MSRGQGKAVIGKVLDQFEFYTRYHFAREEEFLKRTGYPAVDHKGEHRKLVEQVVTLQTRYKTEIAALAIETLEILKESLILHIQGTDAKYTEHFERERHPLDIMEELQPMSSLQNQDIQN